MTRKFKSYAKVNFALKIYNNNINSKHEIDGIFCLHKELYDVVYFTKSNNYSIKYFGTDNNEIKIKDCLIIKTINYLAKRYNINEKKYDIKIIKLIPIEAGLGGGSSNAAVVLNYLSKKFRIKLDYIDVADKLGSDIPFFLSKFECARVRKNGGKVNLLMKPTIKYELILTGIKCNTKEIFDLFDKDKKYKTQIDMFKTYNILRNKCFDNSLIFNDLQNFAIKHKPELKKYIQRNCVLSGSGGSVVKFIKLRGEK